KEAHNADVDVNVAILMRLYDKDDLIHITQEVLEIIKSGMCFNTLQQVINYSNI
ncbi:anthranilate phosphoribosyltransferase, partial [Francisella tularensis subsp. holarctica]|nr:anthranilate phosphoribosyltransferase [Francisella tularensis subsp. holarctica]